MIKRYKDLGIALIISLIAAAAGFCLIFKINQKGAFVFLAVSLLILIMFLCVR